MNDFLQLPLIADIQTTALLYYDEEHLEKCYDFCKNRDIDSLPDIENPKIFYQRNDDSKAFDRCQLTDDRWLDAHTFIFKSDLLERFQLHPIQFVFTYGELTGVVHFSDYNKDPVDNFLFAQFAKYERGLRELAICNKLKNANMRKYFEEKKAKSSNEKDIKFNEDRLEKYDEKLEKMEKAGEFQFFYMDELIGMLRSEKIIHLNGGVVELRNMIMHSRPPIGMTNVHADDFIYSPDTFESFFKKTETLLTDSKRVYNRIAFSEDQLPQKTSS